ncbi:biotin synthase BioB [Propionibacterium freudenreichii]|uniref:biotin synthase BioB n=1 Tax=Propionibacterium freudenreichii TaxID=1744 RepID=UPI0005A5CB65|nr:biotin synthase BioB [Propionibacterium freudenreichii]MDK9319565.1 biotin synthase BioB [Propionibacterium freudenreichii]MDK9343645.1 biotin synthase BioB [Propionibacterium freudenreichii]MDK9669514.1 biotin synthase BioB [Propionibacterium freudenreichii]CEI22527.1 Biotin synthase [Propionibacterium freudenreichii]
MDLEQMTATAMRGTSITRDEALEVLAADDAETLSIVAAAGKVRRRFFGRGVRLNYLVSLKSGLCPENCSYCSQSLGSDADILRYTWLTDDQVHEAVEMGVSHGASTVCLVASGRGPSRREVAKVAGIVARIHAEHPGLHICTCLGFLDDDKAEQLAAAGSDRYNHNLNTAEEHYSDICSTHSYADRVNTVQTAQRAGISACSGLIAGMGETDEELVEVAFALRELGAESVPVNFLLPFEGTPLHSHRELTPQRCLRILSMMRLIHPDSELRSAAGREYHIRTLQPLVLEVCNSIFLGDYLTSEGQTGNDDLSMIRDAGFHIVDAGDGDGGICFGRGNHERARQAVEEELDGLRAAQSHERLDRDGVPIRLRGAGTARVPNV